MRRTAFPSLRCSSWLQSVCLPAFFQASSSTPSLHPSNWSSAVTCRSRPPSHGCRSFRSRREGVHITDYLYFSSSHCVRRSALMRSIYSRRKQSAELLRGTVDTRSPVRSRSTQPEVLLNPYGEFLERWCFGLVNTLSFPCRGRRAQQSSKSSLKTLSGTCSTRPSPAPSLFSPTASTCCSFSPYDAISVLY